MVMDYMINDPKKEEEDIKGAVNKICMRYGKDYFSSFVMNQTRDRAFLYNLLELVGRI
jgi:hypothetical protein